MSTSVSGTEATHPNVSTVAMPEPGSVVCIKEEPQQSAEGLCQEKPHLSQLLQEQTVKVSCSSAVQSDGSGPATSSQAEENQSQEQAGRKRGRNKSGKSLGRSPKSISNDKLVLEDKLLQNDRTDQLANSNSSANNNCGVAEYSSPHSAETMCTPHTGMGQYVAHTGGTAYSQSAAIEKQEAVSSPAAVHGYTAPQPTGSRVIFGRYRLGNPAPQRYSPGNYPPGAQGRPRAYPPQNSPGVYQGQPMHRPVFIGPQDHLQAHQRMPGWGYGQAQSYCSRPYPYPKPHPHSQHHFMYSNSHQQQTPIQMVQNMISGLHANPATANMTSAARKRRKSGASDCSSRSLERPCSGSIIGDVPMYPQASPTQRLAPTMVYNSQYQQGIEAALPEQTFEHQMQQNYSYNTSGVEYGCNSGYTNHHPGSQYTNNTSLSNQTGTPSLAKTTDAYDFDLAEKEETTTMETYSPVKPRNRKSPIRLKGRVKAKEEASSEVTTAIAKILENAKKEMAREQGGESSASKTYDSDKVDNDLVERSLENTEDLSASTVVSLPVAVEEKACEECHTSAEEPSRESSEPRSLQPMVDSLARQESQPTAPSQSLDTEHTTPCTTTAPPCDNSMSSLDSPHSFDPHSDYFSTGCAIRTPRSGIGPNSKALSAARILRKARWGVRKVRYAVIPKSSPSFEVNGISKAYENNNITNIASYSTGSNILRSPSLSSPNHSEIDTTHYSHSSEGSASEGRHESLSGCTDDSGINCDPHSDSEHRTDCLESSVYPQSGEFDHLDIGQHESGISDFGKFTGIAL